MSARAQAELYEALLDANRALLGGNSDVGREAMAAADKLAVFFQPMSPLGDQRRSFCETLIRIGGRKVELPVQHP